jgi:hypothetical protein
MTNLETYHDASSQLKVRATSGPYAGLNCQFPRSLRTRAGQLFRASVVLARPSRAYKRHLVAISSTIVALS